MKDRKDITRRRFLETGGTCAATLAAMAGTAPAIHAAGSANETVGVGCIGLGVRGGTLCRQVAGVEGVKVVAACDVYKPHVEKGVRLSENPEIRRYVDYHDLLADPNVDAVTIATPDHWHSRILMDAARAGKDVYIEKGWTRTIAEARAMLAAVKKYNIVMQLGHQGRESTAGLQASQLIKEGALGPVTLVRTGRFENRPRATPVWRWYGWYDHYDRPDPAQVVRDLDWDRWLGPAPKIPFSMEHFWHWRCYWAYGTGGCGDLLSHELDFVQMVLGHGIPDTCVTSGLNALLKDGREFPDTWNSIYRFEKAGHTVTFDCNMNSNARVQPPVFYGKDAVLECNNIAQAVRDFNVYADGNSDIYRDRIETGDVRPGSKPFMKFDPKKTPPQPLHMQNFIDCVRNRKRTKCNEDEAFIEAATFLMSATAYHEKREVRWDAAKQDIV